MAYETHQFTWRGLTIEARYSPQWTPSADMAHLEIRSIDPARAPLPVTGTGYRSHFHPMGVIEREYGGDVVAAVTDWLDETAQCSKWKAQETAARQGDLFDIF